MFSNLASPYFIFTLITVPLSLTVHEFAHAWTADRLGDDTPRRMGRLTLNPIAHLDPIGLLMILFGPIGWARPVPLQPWRMRRPRTGLCVTALAGPVSNSLLAAVCLLLLRIYPADAAYQPILSPEGFIFNLLATGALVNLSLFAFNLLPVPPLDGWRIVSAFLPQRVTASTNADLYGSLILLFIVLIPQLRSWILGTWVGFLANLVARGFGFHYW